MLLCQQATPPAQKPAQIFLHPPQYAACPALGLRIKADVYTCVCAAQKSHLVTMDSTDKQALESAVKTTMHCECVMTSKDLIVCTHCVAAWDYYATENSDNF